MYWNSQQRDWTEKFLLPVTHDKGLHESQVVRRLAVDQEVRVKISTKTKASFKIFATPVSHSKLS